MLRIFYPFVGQVSESRLNAEVLPVGFKAEIENDQYYRVTDDRRSYVGGVAVVDGGLEVSFIYPKGSGKEFVQGFGIKHPWQNPLQVMFGVVYMVQPGLYQLNKTPWILLSEALEESRHVGSSDAYFVRFLRGAWEKNWIQVELMQKILSTGQLLADTGPATLELGNLENENTM